MQIEEEKRRVSNTEKKRLLHDYVDSIMIRITTCHTELKKRVVERVDVIPCFHW